MNQQTFFKKAVTYLDSHNLPYMVTGSVGAMLFSRPRLTNDMDVVVFIDMEDIADLRKEFSGDEFFFPAVETVLDEYKRKGQFNLIHIDSGSKIDFIFRKDTRFAVEEFNRRQRIPFDAGLTVFSATPEDIIISKMRFFMQGEGDKHIDDIRAMLEISGAELDFEYIGDWSRELGLTDVWKKVRAA